jgi:hypothetical protein
VADTKKPSAFRVAREAAGYGGPEGLVRLAARIRRAVSTVRHYDQGYPVRNYTMALRLAALLSCSIVVFTGSRGGKPKRPGNTRSNAGAGLQSCPGTQTKTPRRGATQRSA